MVGLLLLLMVGGGGPPDVYSSVASFSFIKAVIVCSLTVGAVADNESGFKACFVVEMEREEQISLPLWSGSK